MSVVRYLLTHLTPQVISGSFLGSKRKCPNYFKEPCYNYINYNIKTYSIVRRVFDFLFYFFQYFTDETRIPFEYIDNKSFDILM